MDEEVIWSPLAKKELKEAFRILNLKKEDRPKSKAFYIQLQNTLYRISLNPFFGQPTEVANIRYIIPHPSYTLFYRHSMKKIEILVLWDNSQKLGELKVIPKKE